MGTKWVIRVPVEFQGVRLSDRSRAMLFVLEGYARRRPYCFVGNATLQEATGKQKRTVQEILKELEEGQGAGPWIKRVYVNGINSGRFGIILLRRIDPTMPVADRPDRLAKAEQALADRVPAYSSKPTKTRLEELRSMRYADYLQSEEWASTRATMLKAALYRCQVCNQGNTTLDVHHRDYSRRGSERRSDLVVLCRGCHELFHENGRLAEPVSV